MQFFPTKLSDIFSVYLCHPKLLWSYLCFNLFQKFRVSKLSEHQINILFYVILTSVSFYFSFIIRDLAILCSKWEKFVLSSLLAAWSTGFSQAVCGLWTQDNWNPITWHCGPVILAIVSPDQLDSGSWRRQIGKTRQFFVWLGFFLGLIVSTSFPDFFLFFA